MPETLPRPTKLTDGDIWSLAEFIAKDLGYSVPLADDHGWRWYQEAVGFDVCTESQATQLRYIVILMCDCFQHGGGNTLIREFAVPVKEEQRPAPKVYISKPEMWLYEHFCGVVMWTVIAILACMFVYGFWKGGR